MKLGKHSTFNSQHSTPKGRQIATALSIERWALAVECSSGGLR